MGENIISASGERAAIGGYLPQFDEYAWFVYLNLINKELEWIRVADPKAEKLDDILYATHLEIHAYQVKWTIAEANISYNDFVKLFSVIVLSWKNLKKTNPNKKVFAHLITNKPLSTYDKITNGGIQIGSFSDFMSETWKNLKSKEKVSAKWIPVVEELRKLSSLDTSDFFEFISIFDFQPAYQKKDFSVENIKYSKEDEDLQKISRFIMEQVANPERRVEFSRQEIIQKLGWIERFKTNFNHELVIDRRKYQPIQSTINILNSKLAEFKNGYIFLQGGPGTGKSTLINQWSKQLKQRVVKYYAFDFVNPSSNLNFFERGNATYLFFDLVFQLKDAGIYTRKNVLPYKDIIFLKEVFAEQLESLGKDYLGTGQSTLIVIDGLDHVPREYQSVTNSFLRELPLPSTLPAGVYIILGSQTFELEDLQQEIKSEYNKGNRTIQIDSLKKEEVYNYIDAINTSTPFTLNQKQQIFEKSQGHPLYLSYLMEKVMEANSIDEVIESFDTIDGNIENYYEKIWTPIQKEERLIHLLGLISRIKGSVNLYFINEWDFDRDVLRLFREKAKILFNESEKHLSFFHNSFRQFLLYNSAINYLTDEFDSKLELEYHKKLAEFYGKSKIERKWKQNYHLFQAKKFDEFLLLATPDSFTLQLLNYRPAEEIKQDVKLGIEIAKQSKDLPLLIRYLFALAEIEKRLYNVNPASFTEELLKLNNFDAASRYLRTGNILHCSSTYAFKASRIFLEFGYTSEATALYNLAYPDVITDNGIYIDDSHRYEEVKEELEAWISTASHFETTESILAKIEKILFSVDIRENRFSENEADLFLLLISDLGYSLIEQNKWNDFALILERIDINSQSGENIAFELIQYAIEQCIGLGDNNRANDYLIVIKNCLKKETIKPFGRIYIADLIYKVTGDKDETFNWIKDIELPLNIESKSLDYDGSLATFLPLIKLHKLLNLCNNGVSIITAVPSGIKGSDEEVLVEFQRMLCLIAKIHADSILHNYQEIDVIKSVFPILRFYYKDVSHRNMYWYKITQCKSEYFDYLICTVSKLGSKELIKLSEYLFREFKNTPQYWTKGIQRKIIISLFDNGLDTESIKKQLLSLDDNFMLEGLDLDGRITECLSHSKAWFKLQQNDFAEKWLKRSIQESIGVGYRKDYQFSTWISWLRKVNKESSENANERIKWFLSHLQHIKETTEGRAYWNASEELLETTFEHNLYDGFQQTVWQLNNDLIDFNDSISLFIKYFTQRCHNEEEFTCIVQLYTHLYLILSEHSDLPLLKLLLFKGLEIGGEHFIGNQIGEIVSMINIKAYEDSRHYLLNEIDEFYMSQGLKTVDYYPNFKIPAKKQRHSSSDSSNTLVLNDRNELNENEVIEKCKDYIEFRRILQDEANNSYFKWSKVLDTITSRLSVAQIEEICIIDSKGRRGSDFYASLSKAAYEKGSVDLAKKVAEKSLNLSSESGWLKHFDGGTRIEAFTALQRIDQKASSEKAFEFFIHDIINTNYPTSYIEGLEDIVPLLAEIYDIEEVWSEIFSYLKRFMVNSSQIEELPIVTSIDKPIHETLVDYLMYLSNSHVSIIKRQSIILLSKYIDQNVTYVIKQILDVNKDDYFTIEIVISLFELKSPKINLFIQKIKELAISKDYYLRDNSKRILDELGEEFAEPPIIGLPAILTLHIPEPSKPDFNKKIDPYFPDININDPQDLIRPFDFYIKVLSDESGIEKYNLNLRVHSLMKSLSNEKEWTTEYEKKLRYHLEEINLKYSYPRPRVIAAQKAIMHVVAELIDSETIYEPVINGLFKLCDTAVPFFYEVSKPSFVQIIQEREYGGVGSDWLDRISEFQRLKEQLLEYNKNFKIVAEYTYIKNLDWGAPTEEFMWQVSANDKINRQDNYIFGSLFHRLSISYHDLTGGGDSIIVIRDHRFNQFKLKSRWIAINPTLARYLNWEPEPTKLFAWKDSNGELMAESIYWVNGNVDMVPRKDGEVGEGWFVVVSKLGLEKIKNVEKNLFIQKKLIRSKSEDSIPMNKEILSVIRL